MLYATNDNWSLRWYAERPEYFHFKDCPQDAASIVEWNRRSWVIYQWKLRVFSDGLVSLEELSQGFIKGRTLDFYDWLADLAGLAIGQFVAAWIHKMSSNGKIKSPATRAP